MGAGVVSANWRNRVSLSLIRSRAPRRAALTAAMKRPTMMKLTVATRPIALSTPSLPVAVTPRMAQPPPMQITSATRAAVQPPASAARLTAGSRMVKPVSSP